MRGFILIVYTKLVASVTKDVWPAQLLYSKFYAVPDMFPSDQLCDHSAVTKCKILIDLIDYSGAITSVPLFGEDT